LASSASIVVKLGGTLADVVGSRQLQVELSDGVPLSEIAGRVGISSGMVMLYAVNGSLRSANYCPEPGDEVLFIPAVAGGQALGR
jgi:molybdopterin converting factor small subunit